MCLPLGVTSGTLACKRNLRTGEGGGSGGDGDGGEEMGMRTASTGEAMAPLARQKTRARGGVVARRGPGAALLALVLLAALPPPHPPPLLPRAHPHTPRP